jgi:cbb3-type cytochrome oxidase maturation protein
MYFPYFITYMALGFGISLAVFFWALKNGQFKDQKRARFLPLEDEHEPSAAKISTFNRYEAYALVLLALAGLAASGTVLVFALLSAKGP